MGKVETNKQQKKEALLNTAFELFSSKGINNTSISDIVEKAGVAKGTFYLYFKDKYDIHQKLLLHKTSQLFEIALNHLHEQEMGNASTSDKIIFITNDLIDSLTKNKSLLILISKDLGAGFYRSVLKSESFSNVKFQEVYTYFKEDCKDIIRDPNMMLFLIIEMVAGSCYSSILYNEPVNIEVLKPQLYNAIRGIVESFTVS